MSTCVKCSKPMKANALFCTKCGTKVAASDATPQKPVESVPKADPKPATPPASGGG